MTLECQSSLSGSGPRETQKGEKEGSLHGEKNKDKSLTTAANAEAMTRCDVQKL